MVYDTGYNKEPIPHRCGAVMEYCVLDNDYILFFCSLCRIVVGYEKDGVKMMKIEIVSGYKQKELSPKTKKELQ
jgi:hypothetical protein